MKRRMQSADENMNTLRACPGIKSKINQTVAGRHPFVRSERMNTPPQARGHSYGISRPYLQAEVSLSRTGRRGRMCLHLPMPGSCRSLPAAGRGAQGCIRLAAQGSYLVFMRLSGCRQRDYRKGEKYAFYLCYMREPVLSQKCTLFFPLLQSLAKSVVYLDESAYIF